MADFLLTCWRSDDDGLLQNGPTEDCGRCRYCYPSVGIAMARTLDSLKGE